MLHGSNMFHNDIYANKEHKNNKYPVIISDALNIQGKQSYHLAITNISG